MMECFVRQLIEEICHAIENPLPLQCGLERFFAVDLTAYFERGVESQRRRQELIPLALKQNQTHEHTRHQDETLSSSISVAQIRVLQQRFNGSCGES
jgi:hypothetical protein